MVDDLFRPGSSSGSVWRIATASWGAAPGDWTALLPTEEEQQAQRLQFEKREQARQAAERRARELLEARIGREAVRQLDAGGTYPVRSKLWKDVYYLVPRTGNVLVVRRGGLVRSLMRKAETVLAASCLVPAVGGLPWPDVVLARIAALEADETVLFGRGNTTWVK